MAGFLRAKNTFLAILFLGLFAMATRNVTDPDIWWHLKTGQYIAEHKEVPRTDPFSFTRNGDPWVAHEWLTDLLLYEAQRCAGWAGLILLFAAILAVAFYFLYLRCGTNVYVAGVATLAAAWTTMSVWGVRPQVVSLLFMSVWLLLLERSRNRPRLLWWTLPLTVLWVNLHAGFALGLALSGLFLAGDLLKVILEYSRARAAQLRTQALVLALAFLLVPCNPNGIRMFRYPIATLRSPAMQEYIAEWASPNFHHFEYWPFLILILIMLGIVGRLRQRLHPRDMLLLLVSLFAGLSSIRMIPIFAFVAVPLIARGLGNWPRRSSALRVVPSSWRLSLNAAIVLAVLVFTTSHAVRVIHFQAKAESRQFPAGAVAYLQMNPGVGRIFNDYGWGGYLIWKLYPAPVFIDGRADLYGPLLADFANTYSFRDDWEKTLRRWNIGAVLVPPEAALASGLRNALGWSVAYEDAQAVVFTSGSARMLPPKS